MIEIKFLTRLIDITGTKNLFMLDRYYLISMLL